MPCVTQNTEVENRWCGKPEDESLLEGSSSDRALEFRLQALKTLQGTTEEDDNNTDEESSSSPLPQPLLERYEPLEISGTGVHGTVYRARDRLTGGHVAVKWMHLEERLGLGVPAHVLREVHLLLDFEAPNIVRLLDVHFGLQDYVLVFEHIEQDLHQHLKTFRMGCQQMPFEQVKRFSRQLLEGVHACHCRHIIHRDLKPQNILIEHGTLKICDFGLARMYSQKPRAYTHDVVTVWYRAPEILLGTDLYIVEVDMWSVGCVIAEMATGSVQFPGDSEIGTLFKIFQALGTPTEETWPGVSKMIHFKVSFPQWGSTELYYVLEERPELGQEGFEVLQDLLRLCPTMRSSSKEVLQREFFKFCSSD